MNIYLFIIRHAESDSNRSTPYKLFKDPNLSEKGKNQCKSLRKYWKNKNKEIFNDSFYVYSSVLIRSQETALLSVPKKIVTVSNYLREMDNIFQTNFMLKGSNFPILKIKDQHRKMEKVVKKSNLKFLHYDGDILNDTKTCYRQMISMEHGNIQKFLKMNKNHWKNGDKIFIFCHAYIIKKFLNLPKTTGIENCSVFQVTNQKNDIFTIGKSTNIKHQLLFTPN